MARKPRAGEVATRNAFLDYLESLETRATDEICGVWYSRLGAAKHAAGYLTQWDMFSRPWSHVARYASEELTEWFARNGRMTYTEFRESEREYSREQFDMYANAE
jgi:hypothetical protein